MSLRMVFVLAVSLVVVADFRADEKLKETLLAREKELLDAIKNKDKPKLKEMLAIQALSIDPNTGRRSTPELLRILDEVTLTSYSISDVKVVPLGEGAAMITYKYTWSGAEKGKEFKDYSTYATSTWVLRDGKWMPIFYQETLIAK